MDIAGQATEAPVELGDLPVGNLPGVKKEDNRTVRGDCTLLSQIVLLHAHLF